MSRADFSRFTKDRLAMAANFRCVRPGCGRITHTYDAETERVLNVGSAAHAAAASYGGPRANAMLTPQQLRAYDNGAWLCRLCATIVDEFADDFDVPTITGWQASAHAVNSSNMRSPAIPPQSIDSAVACEGAMAFCKKFEEIQVERFGFDRGGVKWRNICRMEDLIRVCVSLGPLNKLSSRYPHTINKQRRILSCLQIIVREVRNRDLWYCDEDYDQCFMPYANPEAKQSERKVLELWKDAQEQKSELREFAYHGTLYEPQMLYCW